MPKLPDILDSINAEQFYSQYIHDGKKRGKEVIARCPLHEDDKPSFSFNTENGRFNCFGCNQSGHYIEFLMALNKWMKDDAIEHIKKVYGSIDIKPPSPKQEEKKELPPLDPTLPKKFQEALWENGNPRPLDYLRYKRGLTDATIIEWQIGIDGHRYTVPIYDADGNLVNIRKYKPDAKSGEQKWLNTTGYGQARLFPAAPNGAERVLLCEGEFDMLVAWQNGYHAITGTCGCETWKEEWSSLFAGKIVNICYDNDAAGRDASIKVAESLSPHAASVRILEWPLIMPDKGDVTHFFVNLKMVDETFRTYLDRSKEYVSVHAAKLPGNIKSVLPDRGFLRSYMSYATGLSDACPEYHLAAGLSILSVAVGNRVKFYGHAGKLYKPNLWTVLVGPSGDRKSTAVERAFDILEEAVPGTRLPDQYSMESLLKALHGRSRSILYHDEFSKLLKEAGREHMGSLVPLLTELYEKHGRFEYSTIKGGNIVIEDPAFSMIGATTIDWLNEAISENVVRGGFMPRFIFWPGNTRMPRKGLVGPPDFLIRQSLVDYIKRVSQLEGTITFSPDIMKRTDEWEVSHERQASEGRCGPELRAFYKRMPTYLLKFAVLYQISFDCSLDVTIEALEAAIRTIEFVKRNLRSLVEEHLSGDKKYKEMGKLAQLVKEFGPIAHSDLLRMAKMEKYRFDSFITTLIESERIKVILERTTRRPKRIYSVE